MIILSIPEWVNLPTMNDLIITGKALIIIFGVFVAYYLIYWNIYIPWQEKKERQLHPPPPPPPKKWTDKELYELRQGNSWGTLRETTGLTQGQLQHRITRYKKKLEEGCPPRDTTPGQKPGKNRPGTG